jgi:hypothetical protein
MLLTGENQQPNFLFRGGSNEQCEDGKNALVLVQQGTEPVAQVVIQSTARMHAALAICSSLTDVGTVILRNRWSMRVLLAFRRGAVLSDYFDCESIVRQHAERCTVPHDFLVESFKQPVYSFLCDLAEEYLSLVLTGLLYGYPVDTTIELSIRRGQLNEV